MSSGAPQPWTRAQFIEASSASIAALKRRTIHLLAWFLGATTIVFAMIGLDQIFDVVVGNRILAAVIIGTMFVYLLFVIVFAIYIVATARSHARRHRVVCQACAADIPLRVPQLDGGRMRLVRIEELKPDRFPLNCAKCGTCIAHA